MRGFDIDTADFVGEWTARVGSSGGRQARAALLVWEHYVVPAGGSRVTVAT